MRIGEKNRRKDKLISKTKTAYLKNTDCFRNIKYEMVNMGNSKSQKSVIVKKPIITLVDPYSSNITSEDPLTKEKYGGSFIALNEESRSVVGYNKSFPTLLERVTTPEYNGKNIIIIYFSKNGEKPDICCQ